MSSTPFRAAFWALGISFAISVMLLLPDPQKIRLALHAQRHESRFPYQETLVQVLEDQPVELGEVDLGEAEPATAIPVAPVQVASSDVAATINYSPKPVKETGLPDPTPAQSMLPRDLPQQEPQNIPVPDPVYPREIEPDSFVPMKPSTQVEESRIALNESREFPAANSVGEISTAPSEPSIQPRNASLRETSMTALPGTKPDRWTFQFEEASLPETFKFLGTYQNMTVVVDPEIQGEYSGEFVDADPAQAFAILVKLHRCRVSKRGNYLLLTLQDSHRYR